MMLLLFIFFAGFAGAVAYTERRNSGVAFVFSVIAAVLLGIGIGAHIAQ